MLRLLVASVALMVALAAVGVAGVLWGISVAHSQVPPSSPVACIVVARDIHEYSILYRAGERNGWTVAALVRGNVLWKAVESSEAYLYRNDLDAWDDWWVHQCYDAVLRALDKGVQ